MSDQRHGVPPSLIGLFRRFLGFGLRAWGGPAAQIAMLHKELVEGERWVDEARFRRALAVYQALPGPEAHELCCWFGMIARGRAGAIAAGLGFMLPGLVFMLVASWAYQRWGIREAHVAGAFIAAQAAVLALILRASWKLVTTLAGDRYRGVMALLAGIAQVLTVPFVIPLLMSGGAHTLVRSGWPRLASAILVASLVTVLTIASVYSFDVSLSERARPLGAPDPSEWTLLSSGLMGGMLSFGGAYTAIPVVRDIATGGQGWMSDAQFIDGIAIVNVLPSPLVMFGTFVGYLGGGFVGALLMTLGFFAPAFGFTLVGHELFERLVHNERLHAFLDGIAAAVAGMIAATALILLVHVIGIGWTDGLAIRQPRSLFIVVVALVLLTFVRSRWMTPAIVLGAALLGALLH